MNKFKRILAGAALTLVAAFGLTACGSKTNESTLDKNTIYKEELVDLSFPENFQPGTVLYKNGKLYFTGYTYNDDYTAENIWGIVNSDGSDMKTFNIDISNGYVDNMAVFGNGNLALLFEEYYEDDSNPDDYVYEDRYYLGIYDENGNEVKKVRLDEEYDINWVSVFESLDDDSIIMLADSKLYTFDSSLNELSSKDLDDSNSDYYSFYKIKDGSYVTTYWGDNGSELYHFDLANYTLGEKIEVPFNLESYSFMSGSDIVGYDLLLRDSTGISGYNIGDSELRPIFNFVNSDVVSSSFTIFEPIDDKTFFGAYYDWTEDSSDNFKVAKYTKVDPSDVKDKKIITLGVEYLDSETRKDIVNFNKSNDEYRITAVDYEKYNNEDDWSAGTAKLNADIASGQGPDIIISSSSEAESYAAKGAYADLTDYLKNDPDVDYDDIFPNLIEACSYDGKLYMIAPYFYINTLVGKTSALGNKTSWTVDDFMNFANSLPEGETVFSNVTRESFINAILSVNSSEYVDRVKAKTYFDSEDFIKLLEFAATLPENTEDYWETYDWSSDQTAFREDKAALQSFTLSDLEGFNYTEKGTFGEDITFIGYPCKEGNGSSISFNSVYCISSKCKYPEAAWQFIKTYLMKENQEEITYGIPASMSRFDELGEAAKEKPYYMDGNVKVEYSNTYWIGDTEIEIPVCTDEDIAKVKNFILSVNKTADYVSEIENIITEEAAAFFEGQKSAEDVATIIQSRASIYINEIQ